jgi:casein kinase II subunit alpha
MDLPQIKLYLKQLLIALDFCHSRGIIHRDVKPSNIVIDTENQQLCLIDFGLSEFYVPAKDRPLKVASRPYKGPELLVGNRYYDYSLDLWAVGCILGAIVKAGFDVDV